VLKHWLSSKIDLQTGIPIIYNGEEIGMDNNQELILKGNESRDKSVYLDPSFLSSIDLQSRYSTVWHRSEDPTMDNLPFWSTLGPPT
jgi:glycosidase